MPKKRTSADCIIDEHRNEGSESLPQSDDNAKRQKLYSSCDTMLQDLPIELLESILVKVVAMEVKRWKLAKNAWEDKADLVIRRLGTVCTQWSNILTTKFFWNELQRTLDGTAQGTIRLKPMHKTLIPTSVDAVTTLGDDVFMLSRVDKDGKDYVIEIYDRNNLTKVKDVIPIPGVDWVYLMACSVSNCVYAAMRVKNCICFSILRISKDAKRKFNVSPWVFDRRLPNSMPVLSQTGSMLILSGQNEQGTNVLRLAVYDANGTPQHEVILPPVNFQMATNVVHKSNGNFILFYADFPNGQVCLLEFDMRGTVVRQYRSSAGTGSRVDFADPYGRIMITDERRRIELLDTEFNVVGVFNTTYRHPSFIHTDFHYDKERDEIVCVFHSRKTKTRFLSSLRFVEE